MAQEKDHLLAECEKVEENCLYTAQTHFVMAAKKQRLASGWLVVLPSIVSSLSGLAVAIGAKPWVGAFAAVAGVVSGVATFLGVDKEASSHETAGKLLTQLRDDSRALRETYSHDLSAEQLGTEVRAIGNRYRAYVASLPLTDEASFEKARAKIKSGTFVFDSALRPATSPAPQGLPVSPLPAGTTGAALPQKTD
jgi:hypothetical protein